MNILQKEIKKMLIENGASLVGFANINGITMQFEQDLTCGISIAVALKPDIINQISKCPTLDYYREYKRVNNLLAHLGKLTAIFLRNRGFKALDLEPTNERGYYVNLSTHLPHKTVATRAGLGWIGKTALLITEKYGSAIRLTSVLTDVIFDTGTPIEKSNCGSCMICVNECPGIAATGQNWNVHMRREDFFDAYRCSDTALERAKLIGVTTTICGKCIVVCPWTKKYIRRAEGV